MHHTKKKLWIVYGFGLAAESDIGVEWKAAQKKKKITQWDRKRIPGAERAVNVQLTYEDTTDEFGNSPSGEREGKKI